MRRLSCSGAALALAASAFSCPAEAAQADCAKYLSPDEAQAGGRTVSVKDLMRLRDIGSNGDFGPAVSALALSPDRKQLAFQLRRADPGTNSYCLGMFVLALEPGGLARAVDVGGELIRVSYDFRGKAGFATGVAATITPRWTPNGKAVLFLKRVAGITQVWRAHADGGASAPVTDSIDDVVDFQITDTGDAIVFRTQPGLREGLDAIAREGLTGFHYDDRFSPMTGNRPFVPAPARTQFLVQPLLRGSKVRAATPAERAQLTDNGSGPGGVIAGAPGGLAAWMTTEDGAFPPSRTLQLRLRDGKRITCPQRICDRYISSLWWTPDGKLRFLRREGWGKEETTIYEWAPDEALPRRLFSTRDVLSGCQTIDEGVICLREGSTKPRYIARIALPSGRETILYDPNPEFSRLALGKVERLHWKNREGLEIFGDLVFPVGYRPGHRYPLIVVQYDSRGFLRGGTGDEYPIQVFAANGYAVLSFNRPPDIGIFAGVRTLEEAERANLADFADRWSVQSALESGLSRLVERGIADPQRIGITGLSDGASSVQFALLNSRLFRTAAMSSGFWDSSLAMRVGPGSMRDFAAMGYPGAMSDAAPFWDRISIAKNAATVRTPMLLQLADTEYLGALTAFTALRQASAPVDMYVFPQETHIKWQPAHRLAIYRRSLAWFDFWLRDREPTDWNREELAHWKNLRAELAH
ncbi:Dipeptidyl aminopeptidases/acylaminoacyl-peptidases-like protein [Sphingomonas paucimobilis]|nr:Dipeptidyl aminopeptidases/acylaminoacyl-peptidases-like protein [Sphingomonas paucimobilis]